MEQQSRIYEYYLKYQRTILLVKNSSNCTSSGIWISLSDTLLASPAVTVVQPVCGTKGSITVKTPGTSYSFRWVDIPGALHL